MSDDTKPTLTVVPTAADEARAAIEGYMRLMPIVAEAATQIARTRKAMFDAHVAAGFTERQALELSVKFA